MPAAECECECVPAARSSLRGAEPDQGFAGRSRLNDSDSDREREKHARRGAIGKSRCESLYGDALDFQDRARWRNGEDQESAPGGAVSAGQHLFGATGFPQGRLDDEAARRGRKKPLRGIEAGLGGSLSASSGHVCEDAGGAVPPRGLQPVSVESILAYASNPEKEKRPGRLTGSQAVLCFGYSEIGLLRSTRRDCEEVAMRRGLRGGAECRTAGWIGFTVGFQCCHEFVESVCVIRDDRDVDFAGIVRVNRFAVHRITVKRAICHQLVKEWDDVGVDDLLHRLALTRLASISCDSKITIVEAAGMGRILATGENQVKVFGGGFNFFDVRGNGLSSDKRQDLH